MIIFANKLASGALADVLRRDWSSDKLLKGHQHLSLEVVKQGMVVMSAALEATLDILTPGTIL